MIPATHYVHSGKTPIGGIAMTLVAGSIVGGILGALYAALIYWIPFVFLLFILTAGLGIVLEAWQPPARSATTASRRSSPSSRRSLRTTCTGSSGWI